MTTRIRGFPVGRVSRPVQFVCTTKNGRAWRPVLRENQRENLSANTIRLSGDDGAGGVDDCNFTDEEIELILDTLAAHHYNFFWEAPATGDYDVWLIVSADSSESTSDVADGAANTANATVIVGPSVIAVEEVRPGNGNVLEF